LKDKPFENFKSNDYCKGSANMAIVCRKCHYEISEGQIVGYIFSDVYDIAKLIVPAIAPAIILNYYGLKPDKFRHHNIETNDILNDTEIPEQEKRNYIESGVVMFFNKQQVICPSCLKYKGWIDIKNK